MRTWFLSVIKRFRKRFKRQLALARPEMNWGQALDTALIAARVPPSPDLPMEISWRGWVQSRATEGEDMVAAEAPGGIGNETVPATETGTANTGTADTGTSVTTTEVADIDRDLGRGTRTENVDEDIHDHAPGAVPDEMTVVTGDVATIATGPTLKTETRSHTGDDKHTLIPSFTCGVGRFWVKDSVQILELS